MSMDNFVDFLVALLVIMVVALQVQIIKSTRNSQSAGWRRQEIGAQKSRADCRVAVR